MAFISSPIRVLRRWWSNRSYWPGMDEIEMVCALDVKNPQNEVVRVMMSYTLRVGLIDRVRGSGTPLDEGMPKLNAFEPESKRTKVAPSLQSSLPGTYQLPNGKKIDLPFNSPRTPSHYYVWEKLDPNVFGYIDGGDGRDNGLGYVINTLKGSDEIYGDLRQNFLNIPPPFFASGNVDFARDENGNLVNRVEGFSIGVHYFQRIGDPPKTNTKP